MKELAEELHSLLCIHNHTDQCGWFYEVKPGSKENDWDGRTHKHYFKKAEILWAASPHPMGVIISVVKALKSL